MVIKITLVSEVDGVVHMFLTTITTGHLQLHVGIAAYLRICVLVLPAVNDVQVLEVRLHMGHFLAVERQCAAPRVQVVVLQVLVRF